MLKYLSYSFAFDPQGSWSSINDFEIDMAKAFESVGYTMSKIQPESGFNMGPMMILTRQTDLAQQSSPEVETESSDKEDEEEVIVKRRITVFR